MAILAKYFLEIVFEELVLIWVIIDEQNFFNKRLLLIYGPDTIREPVELNLVDLFFYHVNW